MKLGDAVKRVTNALGFETCSACQRRQMVLNRFGDAVKAALLGGPGACELAFEEREEALRLVADLEELAPEARASVAPAQSLETAIAWLQQASLRAVYYRCEPIGLFIP